MKRRALSSTVLLEAARAPMEKVSACKERGQHEPFVQDKPGLTTQNPQPLESEFVLPSTETTSNVSVLHPEPCTRQGSKVGSGSSLVSTDRPQRLASGGSEDV